MAEVKRKRGEGGDIKMYNQKTSCLPTSNFSMSYKEQFIWKRAVELAIHCYKFTNLFPKSELYGLTSQIRRSSVSVASNIAEGYGRRSRQEYIHFLHIALGSLRELDTQFIIAKEVDLTERKLLNPIMNEVEEMQSILVATLNKLKAKNPIKQK